MEVETWRRSDEAWSEARAAWLDGKASNTRRAYDQALRLFTADTEIGFHAVSSVQVKGWVRAMRERALAETTINLRLSALSSFYDYCLHRHVQIIGGAEVALATANPVRRVERATIRPYGKARYLSADEVKALLGAVDRSTVIGARDYALLVTFVYTARRSAEVRRLRWGDLVRRDGRIFYRWSGKGKAREDELPRPSYAAIEAYLRAAGRWNGHPPEDEIFIFTPLSDVATRLPNVDDVDGPISGQMANRILRKWAAIAGLRTSRLTIHSLRHTAAMLRQRAGAELQDLRTLLDHESLAVTQIYVDHVEAKDDGQWKSVADLLGM